MYLDCHSQPTQLLNYPRDQKDTWQYHCQFRQHTRVFQGWSNLHKQPGLGGCEHWFHKRKVCRHSRWVGSHGYDFCSQIFLIFLCWCIELCCSAPTKDCRTHNLCSRHWTSLLKIKMNDVDNFQQDKVNVVIHYKMTSNFWNPKPLLSNK